MRALKALSRESCSDIIFVAKSKSSRSKMEGIKLKLGFENLYCVEVNGRVGGLTLFWKKGMELEVVSSDKYSIVALVYSDPPNSVWLLIEVHGPPYHGK